jgi:hypothetical protein
LGTRDLSAVVENWEYAFLWFSLGSNNITIMNTYRVPLVHLQGPSPSNHKSPPHEYQARVA